MNYESYPARVALRTIIPADVVWDPCSALYTVLPDTTAVL